MACRLASALGLGTDPRHALRLARHPPPAQQQAQPEAPAPAQQQQQQAGVHGSAARKALPDIDRLQLLVEGKLGVPREVMVAVRRSRVGVRVPASGPRSRSRPTAQRPANLPPPPLHALRRRRAACACASTSTRSSASCRCPPSRRCGPRRTTPQRGPSSSTLAAATADSCWPSGAAAGWRGVCMVGLVGEGRRLWGPAGSCQPAAPSSCDGTLLACPAARAVQPEHAGAQHAGPGDPAAHH